MAKRQLNRRQNWRIEKIQGERAARAAKRESSALEALEYLRSDFDTSSIGGVIFDTPCCEAATVTQRNSMSWLLYDAPEVLPTTIPHCYAYRSRCDCGSNYQTILNPKGSYIILRPCRSTPDAVQIPTAGELRIRGKPFEVICAVKRAFSAN